MEQPSQKRVPWIDIYRGLLIICIVTGHTNSPFGSYIYAFHVPAFFFLSGYVARLDRRSGSFLLKRLLTRLAPFYLVNALYILLVWLLSRFPGVYSLYYAAPFAPLDMLRSLFLYTGAVDLGGALWFLPVLFICECVAKLSFDVCRRLKTGKAHLAVDAVLGLLGYWLTQLDLPLRPLNFDLGLFALLFYAFGAWASQTDLFTQKLDRRVMGILCAACFAFLGGFYRAAHNWPTRSFGHLSVLLAGVFSGVYLTWLAADYLARTPLCGLLARIGRRTFAIMAFHFACFKVTTTLLYLLGALDRPALQAFPTPAGNLLWLIYSVCAVAGCALIGKAASYWRPANYLINAEIGMGGK